MSAVAVDKAGRLRFPGVRVPPPVLSKEDERALSARQLDLLEELETQLLRGGVAELTMAGLAERVNCSLRTLYGIASSKDELLLAVVDRRLRRIGRAAVEKLDAKMSPIDALRSYLRAANEAVQSEPVTMSADFASLAGAQRLFSDHEAYLTAVAHSLLDRAVAEGQIAAVDTAAVAHVLGSLGREFARAEVVEIARESPKQTADAITEIVLQGLVAGRGEA